MTQQLSKKDQAVANLIYARDLIQNGKLNCASSLIARAIDLLGKHNVLAVDDEVIRLLKKK